jgi:hypothetical protein
MCGGGGEGSRSLDGLHDDTLHCLCVLDQPTASKVDHGISHYHNIQCNH